MGFLLISMISMVIIVGIIVIIVKLLDKGYSRKMTEKEGEIVMKNVYIYLVLFVTLMMVIGGSVATFMGIADYVAPSAYTESYEQYKDNRLNQLAYANEEKPSEEALQNSYNQMKQDREDRAKAGAVRQIIQSLGWIIIPLPIFMYFQRMRRRENELDEGKG